MSAATSSHQKSRAEPFLLLCRSTWSADAAALLFLLALLVFMRWESFQHFNTHVLGGSERDAGLYLYLLEANSHSWGGEPWFQLPGFYPYSMSLAWSDNFLFPSAFAWIFLRLGISLPATFNFLILAAQLLNGYATFRIVRGLSGSRLAGIFSGAAFMLSSFFSAHLGHPQLQFAFFIPLGLEALLRSINNSKFSNGLSLGLVVTCAFLTTVYYAIFLVSVCLIVMGLLFALRPHGLALRLSLRPALGLFAGLAPLAPFLWPYLSVQATFGERFLHEPYFFAADALSYFSTSSLNLLYGWSSQLSHDEARLSTGTILPLLVAGGLFSAFWLRQLRSPALALFFSWALTMVSSVRGALPVSSITSDLLCAFGTWATLAALLWALYRFGRLERIAGREMITNRALLALCSGAFVVCVLISLGPRGYSEAGPALALHRAFFEGLPGFSAVRAIGRFGVLALFFLVLSAGLAWAALRRKYDLPHWLALPLIALISAENFQREYPLEELPATPQIFTELNSHAHPGEVALVLPFSGALTQDRQVRSWSEFAKLQVNALRFSLSSKVPVVNGYSGQRTKIMREWPSRVADFPSREALSAIGEIAGIRHIIVLTSLLSPENSRRIEEALPSFEASLRVVARDPAGNLLLEYRAARLLDTDGAQLLVPCRPAGVLSLELSFMGKASAPVKIAARSLDTPLELTPQLIELVANGSWQQVSLKLPAQSACVSPVRLAFSLLGDSASKNSLYLRQSSFEPLPD